jgi:hypothetical protein
VTGEGEYYDYESSERASPSRLPKSQGCSDILSAEGGNRTRTSFRTRDFKVCVRVCAANIEIACKPANLLIEVVEI